MKLYIFENDFLYQPAMMLIAAPDKKGAWELLCKKNNYRDWHEASKLRWRIANTILKLPSESSIVYNLADSYLSYINITERGRNEEG